MFSKKQISELIKLIMMLQPIIWQALRNVDVNSQPRKWMYKFVLKIKQVKIFELLQWKSYSMVLLTIDMLWYEKKKNHKTKLYTKCYIEICYMLHVTLLQATPMFFIYLNDDNYLYWIYLTITAKKKKLLHTQWQKA